MVTILFNLMDGLGGGGITEKESVYEVDVILVRMYLC